MPASGRGVGRIVVPDGEDGEPRQVRYRDSVISTAAERSNVDLRAITSQAKIPEIPLLISIGINSVGMTVMRTGPVQADSSGRYFSFGFEK